MGIESISSQSLYFSALQNVAAGNAREAQKNEKSEKTQKKRFSSIFEKTQQEFALEKEGLPKEIAGLEPEEAAVWLKDQADMAADILKEKQTPDTFQEYRKRVSQFLRYISKNNFEVKKRIRRGFTRKGKPLDPHYTIVVINQKLDEMAAWLLSSHKETLGMLSRLDEVRGMLIDLMAA